jgi:DNA-binding NtrC family response regulator
MSARNDQELADAALRFGAVTFLPKPIALGSYSHAVREVLHL